jgi:hypothetical protein
MIPIPSTLHFLVPMMKPLAEYNNAVSALETDAERNRKRLIFFR